MFQEIVQADFIAHTKGGGAEREFHIDFGSRGKGKHATRNRTGRVDLWIDDLEHEEVAVFEIKATDWDLIAPGNIRRNIYRHQKQLSDYVDKYRSIDDLQVTYGLIYPYPPATAGLRERIEHLAMTAYCVPVYWYTDLDPEFNPARLSSLLEIESPGSI